MKSFFKTPEREEKYSIMIGDFVGISGILLICFVSQIAYRGQLERIYLIASHLALWPRIVASVNLAVIFLGISLLFCILYIPILYIFGLYEFEWFFNKKQMFIKLSAGTLLGAILLFCFFKIFLRPLFIKEIWIFQFAAISFTLFLWRYIFSKKLFYNKPLRVLMTDKDRLLEKAEEQLNSKFVSQFLITAECSGEQLLNDDNRDYDKNNCDYEMIVYPFSQKLSQEHLIALVKRKFEGYSVCSSLTFYKNLTGRLPVFELEPQWLIDLSISLNLKKQFQQRIKRIIDIVFSSIGIVISLPVMVLAAIAIKTTSRGPIFFVHERLGVYRKPFRLYKFRTMVDDAEKATGPVWARVHDPRITKTGGLLRRTRMDELPQFFNILLGDMSFIGPRPIRKYFADILSKEFPYYFLRFYVKPGLTGWAQVSGDYGDTLEKQLDKLEYELFYIHEYSLLLDAVIFLKTIQNVLRAKGQ